MWISICMLWVFVCLFAFSIQVFAAMLVLAFNMVVVCICSLRPQAFFPHCEDNGDYTNLSGCHTMKSCYFFAYLKSDLRTVSLAPTHMHTLTVYTYSLLARFLLLSLSGKPLSINASTVHWLARHKSWGHNYAASQNWKSVMTGKKKNHTATCICSSVWLTNTFTFIIIWLFFF